MARWSRQRRRAAVVLAILGFIYQKNPAFPGANYTFQEQSMSAVCAISISPVMLLGGIAKNEKMASVIALFPLTQGIQLMKAASLWVYGESVWIPASVMGIVTILCTSIAVKFFKWE